MLIYGKNDDWGKEIHCGETRGIKEMNQNRNVAYVQADGDELLIIKEQFVNIPYAKNKSVQIWYGDMAQFITSNFPVG